MNPNIEQAFQEAARLHQSGRIAEAEPAYRHVISLNPGHADALHLLGIALHQQGRNAEGVELVRRAIAVSPRQSVYHANLGVILAGAGELVEAAAALEHALALNPDFPDALNNLGNVHYKSGRLDAAAAAYRRAATVRGDYADASGNLGRVLQEQGKLDEAIAAFRRATQTHPYPASAFNGLGIALQSKGEFEDAIGAFRRAIERDAASADAHGNLGSVLGLVGRLGDAIAALRRAIELRPDSAELHSNLANVLRDDDQLDAALDEVNRALALKPELPHALGTLGGVLKDRGQLDESITAYRRAVELADDPRIFDSLLLTLHYHPDYDARKLFAEHVEWDKRFAARFAGSVAPYVNDRSADRRLRVGYVGDLSNSPVGRFLIPLLAHHRRSLYEACCYADVQRPDATTGRLRSQAVLWREVAGLSDEQLAARVREDRIDILVDLQMHGGRNRLLAFARKPAPVQVTYLAYAGTTGLKAIDYRLTDPHLDPTDDDQPFYSERSVWLPATYWCYEAPKAAPAVVPPPALSSGVVAFGSLNRSAKVTPHTFAAWCELLARVPESRLLLHWGEGSHREHARRQLAERGIDPNRLEFVASLPFDQYLRQYNRIDIALDPFPYPGGTTSCDGLWMGVPVVTLAGRTASSRGGLSILTNVGLPELVSRSVEEYIGIAAALARDVRRLESLRAGLRDRMRKSPLMDATRFAGDVEGAFRWMWRRWCEGRAQAAG